MPTEKPRVTFTVSKEMLDEIERYRFENRSKNQSQAILSLIERGLESYENENSPATSIDEARELTKQELSRISAAMAQMNEEGREKVVEYAEDLAAGGRYKKHGSDELGEKEEEVG